MGEVVDLAGWRERRRRPVRVVIRTRVRLTEARGARAGDVEWHPSFGRDAPSLLAGAVETIQAEGSEPWPPETVRRLERAVSRLDRAAASVLQEDGALADELETELFALIGQVQMGMLDSAAERAERLAARIGRSTVRAR
jgi:hypothetical protein